VSPDLRHYADRSLHALAREAPAFYAHLCATLRGQRLHVNRGREEFALHFQGETVVTAPPDGSEDLHLGVDRRTILALFDGELTLEEALLQDRLTVRGSLAQVSDMFDALLIYLRGAIRCPSFPSLLSDFRAPVRTPRSEV
jgi:hypothetical protein